MWINWEFGLGGLFMSALPCIAYFYVLNDDSSKNRRFFYYCFCFSGLAFLIYLIDVLITFYGNIESFCTILVQDKPDSSNWDTA